MPWRLIRCEEERECTLDDSGIYVLISRHKGEVVNTTSVRCDIMDSKNVPLVSFIGHPNAVRKDVMHWLADKRHRSPQGYRISPEHASYIGYELAKAYTDYTYTQE